MGWLCLAALGVFPAAQSQALRWSGSRGKEVEYLLQEGAWTERLCRTHPGPPADVQAWPGGHPPCRALPSSALPFRAARTWAPSRALQRSLPEAAERGRPPSTSTLLLRRFPRPEWEGWLYPGSPAPSSILRVRPAPAKGERGPRRGLTQAGLALWLWALVISLRSPDQVTPFRRPLSQSSRGLFPGSGAVPFLSVLQTVQRHPCPKLLLACPPVSFLIPDAL